MCMPIAGDPLGLCDSTQLTTCGYLKRFNAKDAIKPKHNRNLWAGASRSPEDRKKGKVLATYKKILIDVGLVDADMVDFDSRRGILWIGNERVDEWVEDGVVGKLMLSQERLNKAGVNVEVKMLEDAVTESLTTQ